MRLSGFTIVRNVIEFGYPFEESLRSLLPLVDELVVAVGDSRDGTWEAVQQIADPKINAFRTTWDLRQKGGRVLSQQTNLALERCRGSWAVYLQADEVLHEDDLPILRSALKAHENRHTEALSFRYLHFVGSYGTIGNDWRYWCPTAFRAVKLGMGIESVGDAAGFRIRKHGRMRGLIGAPSGARVFHYGWCREPAVMAAKQMNLEGLYGAADAAAPCSSTTGPREVFLRRSGRLRVHTGSHPGDMEGRVAAQDWSFDQCSAGPSADQRGYPLASVRRHGRRFVRYFIPQSVKNVCWRGMDGWGKLAAGAGAKKES